MQVTIRNPFQWDEPTNIPPVKRPNRGYKRYGKYKLAADLEFAKMVARQEYNNRVKNQKNATWNN